MGPFYEHRWVNSGERKAIHGVYARTRRNQWIKCPTDRDHRAKFIAIGAFGVVYVKKEEVRWFPPNNFRDWETAMLRAGVLEQVTIDELIEDAIHSERNETDKETLPDLQKLRRRLERCLA